MDYQILGHNMQALKINLDKGERVYADSGKLLSKSSNVIMTPRMAGGLVSAIERKLTGASALLTEFAAKDKSGNVSVAGLYPGSVFMVDLKRGDSFAAEDHAFLAAEEAVKFNVETVSLGAAFFGGAGLILQKFVGPGKVFIHIVGDPVIYNVGETDQIEIDPGHIAGFNPSLKYGIRFVDNVRTAMFGGVGLFLATFKGKGSVIAHSVSRLKLSSEIYLEGKQGNKQ
ncbi:MAG: TIGR00266 family protein [Candidatus Micrarchaeota archaeon]|nr:TIGR00266 family protein [Candidatus Micrarchaeota archaeon]